MPCTQCGKMTPMPQIRFVPDGKVKGVVNVPKHNAVCSKCLLQVASKPENQEEQAAVVADTQSGYEDTQNEYPF